MVVVIVNHPSDREDHREELVHRILNAVLQEPPKKKEKEVKPSK